MKRITILFILCFIYLPDTYSRVTITYDQLCRPKLSQVFEDNEALATRIEETRNWLNNNLALRIERDPIWAQVILPALYSSPTHEEPFFRVDGHEGLFLRPQNYRVDLIFFDLIQQVNRLLEDRRFQRYKIELQRILGNNPIANFSQWYTHLKDLAQNNDAFKRAIDNNVLVQIYNANGAAHPFEISIFTPQRSEKIRRNRDIARYNEYGQDPEAFFLMSRFTKNDDGVATPLTVIEVDESSRRDRRELDSVRDNYYLEYCNQVRSHEYCARLSPDVITRITSDGIISDAEVSECHTLLEASMADRTRRDHRTSDAPYFEISCKNDRVRVKTPEGASSDARTIRSLLFNTIEELPYKLDVYQAIDEELFEMHGIRLPKVDGRMILTPSLIHAHRELIKDIVHDFSYNMLLSAVDDDVILSLRRWIGRNNQEITELQRQYNLAHPNAPIELSFRHPNFRIRRFEALDQFDDLKRLYEYAARNNLVANGQRIENPTPWNEGMHFDLIGPNGHPIILGHNRVQRIADAVGFTIREMIKPENLLARTTEAGVLVLTGNLALARASSILMKDAIHAYVYDLPIYQAFRDTPLELASALVSSSGFVPGRIPYLAFSGSVHGGVRALLTGQDIPTSMLVGSVSEVARNTLLPYDIAHPTIALSQGDVIDRDYIIQSTLLGVGTNMIYQGGQGAATALLSSDETVGEGLAKGLAYGAIEEGAMIKLFGYQYDMMGLYGEDVVREAMRKEAEYTFDVETYGINLEGQTVDSLSEKMFQETRDVEYRVGGWWPTEIADASFSGFGFISSPGNHLPGYFEANPNTDRGSLISHEVGQHQTQWRDMSSMGFLTTYSVFSIRYGTAGGQLKRSDALLEDPTRDWNPMEQYRTHD